MSYDVKQLCKLHPRTILRFTHLLRMFLSFGLKAHEALTVLKPHVLLWESVGYDSIQRKTLEKQYDRMIQVSKESNCLSKAFEESKLFPSLFCSIVVVGTQNEHIEVVLEKLENYFKTYGFKK